MRIEIVGNGDLRVVADPKDRAALRIVRDENPDDFDRDVTMYDALEHLLANSEYDWCDPEDIGALTSAPILCVRSEDGAIAEAWGFMDYQVRSVQQDLLEKGEAIFQKG